MQTPSEQRHQPVMVTLSEQQQQHQIELGNQSSKDIFADIQSRDMWDTPSPTPSTSFQPQQDASNMPSSPVPSMACPSPSVQRTIHSANPSTLRAPSTTRKRKRDNRPANDTEVTKFLSQCRQSINVPINSHQIKDQTSCFGDWVATKMRLLNQRNRNTAEMRISQLLCQLESEQNDVVVLKPGQMVVENDDYAEIKEEYVEIDAFNDNV